MLLTASQCIPWLVVLITECLAIVILNIVTIIVFVKQRQLQRRSTYLIIHLAIVDLLVGAVTGPLRLKSDMGWYCNTWKYNWDLSWSFHLKMELLTTFPFASFLNLAVISLERVHATFCPFRHRFIKKWVYGVIIIVIWVTTVSKESVGEMHLRDFNYRTWYFSCYFIPLFVICVSYISVYIKVRCSRHPQHHGAAGQRETKLTRTLFIITIGSLLTWLPVVIYQGLSDFTGRVSKMFNLSRFQVRMIGEILVLGNSLINPLIYAIRMPKLRAGILQIIFRRAPNRLNAVDLPLHNL